MVAIPITMGPRSRIRVQPTRGLARSLAAAADGDQEGAVYVRHVGHAEVVWGVRDRLRAGAGAGERQVRFVAEGHPEPVWGEAGECDEGDACVDIEGEE